MLGWDDILNLPHFHSYKQLIKIKDKLKTPQKLRHQLLPGKLYNLKGKTMGYNLLKTFNHKN